MDVITLTLGALETNCYILDCSGGEAVVIDPGDCAEKILAATKEKGLEIKKILLTHGHFDHTGAADEIRNATGAPVYIDKADVDMLGDRIRSFAFFSPAKPFTPLENVIPFDGSGEISQGAVKLKILSTPGHSAGSVCFIYENESEGNLLFSGDTLFRDSIGRSDGYTGNPDTLMDSLEILKSLEKEYTVYPGHGSSTKLSIEREFNPFLRSF